MNAPSGFAAALFGSATVIIALVQPALTAPNADQVNAIARQVTVQIEGQASGSGVIIARQGQTYTVLTAAHVVATPDEYDIITPDGKKHKLDYKLVQKFPNQVDLALVPFTSPQAYKVVDMGIPNQPRVGNPAFVSGFPQIQGGSGSGSPSLESVQGQAASTAYRFADGDIVALATRPLANGYALAYYNDTFAGMSGGPILNQQGQLIGIHGASRTALTETQGLSARFGVKFGLNLGIPIETFLRLAPQVNSALKFPTPASQPVATQLTASDYYIQGVEQSIAGNHKGALAKFEQALRLQPNYGAAYLQRGEARFGLGDKQGALADFNQAIRLNPTLVNGYNARAVTYLDMGNTRAAITDLNQAIRLAPNESTAYINRAFAKLSVQDAQGAIEDANQGLRLNPNSANTYNIRAGAYFMLADYPKVIADASQALRIDPKFAQAYNTRGAARRKSQDFQGAIADFDQAIRLDPNYVDALDNRGLTRIQNLKDFRGGAADYDQSLRINANNPQALLNRGFARIYLNDRPGARADWEKAAELARAQNNARLYESATNNLRQLERIER